MMAVTEHWQTGEWIWSVVAVFFAVTSPVFVPFAIRSRDTRKDIWTALSFTWVCWMWVGIALFNIVGWSLVLPPWK